MLRKFKVLVTKCYWHPYIHKLNSDKETQFFKKSYFKSYSHVLYRITALEKSEMFDLLPRHLYKRDSTTDIFLRIFNFFSDKLFHKTAPNH